MRTPRQMRKTDKIISEVSHYLEYFFTSKKRYPTQLALRASDYDTLAETGTSGFFLLKRVGKDLYYGETKLTRFG